jgi:hypothetical protein
MAGNIFINYRRDDEAGFTQALYSRLEQAFPPESLFMDVDNIAPGLDFVQVLNDQVARCDVLIAVIGKSWLAADEKGERRLDNPEDFVRIEIESALAQKKRVIPVLVNDAKMPRSTGLPESLKAFARCNAVRLTHERFRADMQGFIKALEGVLAESDATRRAEQDAARRKAKEQEKAEAERLRQERREQSSKRNAKPAGERTGLVNWIAGLPSEINWLIPIAVVAILFLGWFLPAVEFEASHQGMSWIPLAVLYGLAGLLAVGLVFQARRSVMGGAELALYWFACICLYGVAAAVILRSLNLETRPISNAALLTPAIAILTAVILVASRWTKANGLELAVYWFGLALFLFWGTIGFIAYTSVASELGAYLSINPYFAGRRLLLAITILSALAILAWRNRRLSRPELAVYLLGIAYWLLVALRFGQT